MDQKAFTLIELLVVIAVIGILSGLIVISMNNVTASANDARIKANLDSIRKALVIYGTFNGMSYPIQSTQCEIGNNCTTLATALADSLPVLPVSPDGTRYKYMSDGTSFTLWGKLASSSLAYTSQSGTYVSGPVDADGNVYPAVKIGDQTWMASNLMTTKYRDGTSIPYAATWSADIGAYGYPPNIGNTAVADLNTDIIPNNLGFVYQWSVVNNSKGLCPSGWHVPSDAEWCTLEQYLDSSISCSTTGYRGTDGGKKLKEAGTAHWTSHANQGNNLSGFSAIASGYRGTTGSFNNRSTNTYFWSSTVSSTSAWDRHLDYSEARVYRNTGSQAFGFSVRCLKD